ncbi:fibronectin type III domain-containing protein [Amycolatopsis nigrescens]|uniref:fibronectin type III domain-containing protein n=1 Tax=Amycolatopsis nigrescens TaxID=381445 RepID=UPI00035D4AF3|nr:fibronectin type III domain-containing protein [Amycolatopsis nigrescens]
MAKGPSQASDGWLAATAGATAKRNGAVWRRRAPFALSAIVCVTALVAVLSGAAQPAPDTRFALTGHWVFNSVLQKAFHVDGATANIDAQATVPGTPGSQVVQGETSSYVVGSSRITAFGKSTLMVEQTIVPPVDEVPVGIETEGGPYLVYRNAGKIVRLGGNPTTLSTGGAVGDPVVTGDGTLWLHRTGAGLVCTLPKGAERISSCPVTVPKDHAGALTVVGDRPEFVDLTSATLHRIEDGVLGAGVPIGVPVSPDSGLAPTEVGGKVAILDRSAHRLLLADPMNPPATPVTVPLPPGDYLGPVAAGPAVAVLDRASGTVLTYGADGAHRDTKPLPRDSGEPRLSRGEDNRAYIEDGAGSRVLIVGTDGKIQDVPVVGKPALPAPVPVPDAGPPANQPASGPPDPRQQSEPRQAGEPPKQSPGPKTPKVPPPAKPVEQRQPAIPAGPPGAPASVRASAGDGTAKVNWGAAADNRSAITSYRVSWRTNSGQTGSVTVSGGAREATVNGLTNGTQYVLTVTAINQVGTGPGASAEPVAPFAAAKAPAVTARYQNGDANVSWSAPDLRGGTLVHYAVGATGLGTKTVQGTNTVYTGLKPGQTVTFEVRAVTRTATGQTLQGAVGSASITVPERGINIVRGRDGSFDSCEKPDCSYVNATMRGFEPSTTYDITLSSTSNGNVRTEEFSTNASGDGTYNELAYDVPGETVWISVSTPNGKISSNKLYWEPR